MGDALDYSYARPDPNHIRDSGYELVFRYLGNDSRCLTPSERDRLHAAGLRIALIGQTTIKRPLSGYSGGWNDADAYNWSADILGAPKHVPIIYVVDVGKVEGTNQSFPLQQHWPAITDYFRGIIDCSNAKGHRPVGGYGPYSVVENVLRNLPMHCYWQTAGDTYNVMGEGSGGSIVNLGDGSRRKVSSAACAYQMYGGVRVADTDHNVILKRPVTDWSWHPNDPAPGPEEEDEEDDMAKIVYAQTKPGSEWALKVLGNNAQGHWFSMSGGIVRHIGPAEKEHLDKWLYIEAVSGVPEAKRSIQRVNDPIDDHEFTAGNSFVSRDMVKPGWVQ